MTKLPSDEEIVDITNKNFSEFDTVYCTSPTFHEGAKWMRSIAEMEIEKLESKLKEFKHLGTDGCSECDTGRYSMFYYKNRLCTECEYKKDLDK